MPLHQYAGTCEDAGLEVHQRAVCSQECKGAAESFVNTFQRDFVARMDLGNAQTVLSQLPAAFDHFNEMPSHPSLKIRSPPSTDGDK